MRIVICGKANFLSCVVSLLKNQKHDYTLIVPDEDQAKHLVEEMNCPVLIGDYTKKYSFIDADVEGADLYVALGDRDESNFVACMLAKRIYNVSKVISLINNPNNVAIFNKLGIDVSVSSVQLIAESINNNSTNEKILQSLSMENDEIKIIELIVKKEYAICKKILKDVPFPKESTIAAIFRNTLTIIPKGYTEIKENDKLIICCTKKSENEVISFITRQ